MKCIGYILFSLFICSHATAQSFGGNPAVVKWQQVNTDTVRVIFPKGWEQQAQRVTQVVHRLQREQVTNLGTGFRKVSIVLQNQTLLSNAYVGLAPFRSEFYTTPPQNAFTLGAVNWLDNLAVHEYRHVQQYNNFNKGLSRFATWLLGEQGQLLANALSVPDWFFEGDAVFNETRYTGQGRGRLPLFLSSYQSLLLSNRQYEFMKLRNGSLRDYVPNHYELGYLLVAYGRKKYGDDIWRKITDDAARFRSLFYPFQGAVKKHTGISYTQFVENALQYYRQQWQTPGSDQVNWLTPAVPNEVTNYQYPQAAADGSIIVLKTGNRSIPAFYKVAMDGKEARIAVKDISADTYFTYQNGKIVYAAYQPDARYGNREYQSIRELDVLTGKEKILLRRSRYFSPAQSNDGKRLLAVEMDVTGHSKLVHMDTEGNLLDSFTRPGIVFSTPRFSADDRFFYVAERNQAGEMSLVKYGSGKSSPDTLMAPANRLIGYLTVQSDTVLFTTTYQGRDELWAFVDGKEKRGPYRLASYATGLYQGVLRADGNLVSTAFTAEGYRLGLFRPRWERVEWRDELTERYLSGLYSDSDRTMLASLSAGTFPVTKYPKSTRLLNLHSFRPFYEQPEYSLTLYGENVLNTLQSEIAYTYNENEGSHKLGYNGAYGGSFLQPVFGLSNTWQRSGALNKDTVLNWNELVGYAGLRLPLNLTGGKQYRNLTLTATYHLEKVNWTGLAQKLLTNRSFPYLQTRIAYSGQIQKTAQQIYPHLGQSLVLQYRNLVNNYTAYQFLATGSLFLPGISNDHSLVVTAAFHSRDTLQQYLFANNFPFARGYFAVDFPRMWKIGVNYHFTWAYPDKGFGNLVYLLRVRSNLFFDYGIGRSLRLATNYPFQTLGTELFFDTRWWNQQPVTFGVRYSRLLNNEFRGITRPNVWELVLPVNLF
ncbi:MAG: hypothetical protein EPO58_16855 [Chitinophagaceae bacterium]|nr:MAG: hypothetical protein EPO58_16855 [Chitinophagaceae bacterium]